MSFEPPTRPTSIVGWREVVSLPDWGIDQIIAKIDTGARTSALHVENLVEHGNKWLEFEVVLGKVGNHKHIPVRCKFVRRARVRSSSGHTSDRYVVRTTLKIGDVAKKVEISLVSRRKMECRMLIGRTALSEDFFVDVSKRYIHGKPHK